MEEKSDLRQRSTKIWFTKIFDTSRLRSFTQVKKTSNTSQQRPWMCYYVYQNVKNKSVQISLMSTESLDTGEILNSCHKTFIRLVYNCLNQPWAHDHKTKTCKSQVIKQNIV